jgi:uncharacterized damage-inducible protein DinB
MKRTALLCAIGLTMALTVTVRGQSANPLSAGAMRTHGIVKTNITKAADMMSEANYSFKPTPDVRSFGELLGHVADAQYLFCAPMSSEKPPADSVEKTKKTKAELTKALADAFAYCDKVHAGMTDTGGTAIVKIFAGDMPKLSVLEFNTHHNFEHYGNIVTYMRLKGLVPPSSQPSK